MARNVNVFTSGWRTTGVNRTVAQRALDIRIDWIDNAGAARTRTETVNFPDCLATFSADELKDIGQDIILREIRKRAGVDS